MQFSLQRIFVTAAYRKNAVKKKMKSVSAKSLSKI